jgi:hypothetical protein
MEFMGTFPALQIFVGDKKWTTIIIKEGVGNLSGGGKIQIAGKNSKIRCRLFVATS